MSSILVDTGPLVALCDPSDGAHEICEAAAATVFANDAVTTVPVLVEAFYLLRHSPAGVQRLMNVVTSGVLDFVDVDISLMERPFALMRRYEDTRMDFADATLVAVAETRDLRTIFTLDRRDFGIYQIRLGYGSAPFEMIP